MAVTFVIGRAASGKTRRQFCAIVEAMRQDPMGPPIYWLLPRQATFNAERDLTCRSGLEAFCRARVVSFDEFGRDVFEECGGSSIPHVTALGRQMIIGHLLRKNRERLRFYSRVARQPGLPAELDRMFDELERSGKSATDLHHWINDLGETNAADLELAPLLDKLRDVQLLYAAYTQYLGQERLDQHRRLVQVESSLSRCSFLKQTLIYVDGFLDFTEYERRILVGAAKAGATIEIALLVDLKSRIIADPDLNPDEMGLFRRTEETYKRLFFAFREANVSLNDSVKLDNESSRHAPRADGTRSVPATNRFFSPSLDELERHLFRDPPKPVDFSDGVELNEAPDRACEVDAVARRIRELLMGGLRFREIGVLARDLERYQPLIESSFREHDIPHFLDRRRPATHHPLLEFVRSLFQIARHDWPHEAVMTLLRSGLAGVDLYDADGLENYVLAHRIRGAKGWQSQKPWGYRRRSIVAEDQSPAFASEPQKAESIRQHLLERLKPLISKLGAHDEIGVGDFSLPRYSGGGQGRGPSEEYAAHHRSPSLTLPRSTEGGKGNQTPEAPRTAKPESNCALAVREIASEIFATMERFGVRATLAKWVQTSASAKEFEQSAEHEQVWQNLVELFDQMVDLLGDESMSADEFYDVLESGLDSFDLALTPPTVDQVVVGQVDRARTGAIKAVFVLGLNEGEFPYAPSDGSILTDRDRRTLRNRRIDLDPGLEQRLLDERLLGYIAFTRASDRLIVSRALADDEGRATEPSSFWRRIVERFPTAPRRAAKSPHASEVNEIATPRQLITCLMRWVRKSPDPVADSADPVWPALYQWLAGREDADDAIGAMRYRAWRALSYQNTAGLSSEIAADLFRPPLNASVSQIESFAACPFKHFARYSLGLRERERQDVTVQDLGRLYHDLLETALKDVMRRRAEGDRTAKLEQSIEKFIEQVGTALRDEIMLGSARNRYLLDRTRRTSAQIALAQRELMKRGQFRPAHVGVTFGPEGNLPPLRIGTENGDVLLQGKIDRVDRAEGSDDIAVIDYRLGYSTLPVGMVLHGLSLQLLSYLLVLEANGQRLSGRDIKSAAAFYLQLVRRIEDVKHPDESTDPSDPKWRLALKPRGLFDRRCLPMLDKELQPGGWSEVVHAYVKQDGSLGRAGATDAAESAEFRAILKAASEKLSELADGILHGRIDISPYRLKDKSPCPRCEYRPVCRFDPAINRYNHLTPLSKQDVLSRAAGGTDGK